MWLTIKTLLCLHYCWAFCLQKKARSGNKHKLAAISTETPRIILREASHGTSPFLKSTRIISRKLLRRLKAKTLRKLSLEVSETELRIFGPPSELDEFLLNPQTRTLFKTVPRTSRNADLENQPPTGDHSQNISYPDRESADNQSISPEVQLTQTQTCFSHEHRSSRRNPPRNLFRKTREGAIHNSATISQSENLCGNWRRSVFVGRSRVGKQ